MIFLQGPPTQRFLLACLSWLPKCPTLVTVIATTSTLRFQSSLRARYYVIGTIFSTEISSKDTDDNSENSNSCKRAGGGKISLKAFRGWSANWYCRSIFGQLLGPSASDGRRGLRVFLANLLRQKCWQWQPRRGKNDFPDLSLYATILLIVMMKRYFCSNCGRYVLSA